MHQELQTLKAIHISQQSKMEIQQLEQEEKVFEQLVELNNQKTQECDKLQSVCRNLEIKLRVSESDKMSLHS